MDDLCPRQQGAQLAAPGGAVVHNDAADPGLQQLGGQIVADPAAAAEHDPPDLPGEDAPGFSAGSSGFRKGR